MRLTPRSDSSLRSSRGTPLVARGRRIVPEAVVDFGTALEFPRPDPGRSGGADAF